MKLPYNCLGVYGSVLFAARGGKIHSFSLDNGSHLSTWEHPDLAKLSATTALKTDAEDGLKVTPPASQGDSDAPIPEPPAKRQKIGVSEDSPQCQDAVKMTTGKGQNGGHQNGKQGKRQKRISNRPAQSTKFLDQPMITLMTLTTDGSHLLAVSGHDKSLWVFEHSLNGQLKQLSQRKMPKRPSSVLIAPDNKTILCADKFGDVYSLPLIEAPKVEAENSARQSPAPVKPKAYKPEASNLTVHSRGNLKALANQQLALERGDVGKSERPTFEHHLVLGHVSLLTAMTLGHDGERKFIITADRDEHIRVSRYMPQSHVIENYCLGHADFINALTIPPQRPEVLVSGGGDNELFVWDWRSGRHLSKYSILEHARELSTETTKVAVSVLSSAVVDNAGTKATIVVAICEGLPGLFVFELIEQNSLVHMQTIHLSGNPLHLSLVIKDDLLTGVLVAINSGESQQELLKEHQEILAFNSEGRELLLDASFKVQDKGLREHEVDVSADDVRDLVYNIENLRKQDWAEEDPEQDDLELAAETEAVL